MALINVNNASIQYEEKGTGPAIVLVHGFPFDHRMWNAQLRGLSDQYRVVAPDLRGFGGSAVTGPFSIEILADDIHALAQTLQLGPIVLGGLSMGGYVTLAYAKKYPANLRGLIFMDTRPEADSPQARENRDKMIDTALQQGPKPIADSMLPRLLPEATAKHNSHLVRDLRAMMDNSPVEGIVHILAAMRDRPDQTALLPSISTPTLILCGEKDVITPPDVMKVFHDNIPRSQLRIVPNAGHMSPMEQPEMVNQAIHEFMQQL